MRRLWGILRGHERVCDDDDRERRAIGMKLDALRTGAARIRSEAEKTEEAAAQTERAGAALMRRLAEDFPR